MSNPTVDIASILTVVLVGLDDAAATACAQALRPIQVVRVPTVDEARTEIAQRHPLVVVTRRLSASDYDALREVIFACGAELVKLGQDLDLKELRKTLLEALESAERRRHVRS